MPDLSIEPLHVALKGVLRAHLQQLCAPVHLYHISQRSPMILMGTCISALPDVARCLPILSPRDDGQEDKGRCERHEESDCDRLGHDCNDSTEYCAPSACSLRVDRSIVAANRPACSREMPVARMANPGYSSANAMRVSRSVHHSATGA